MIRKLALLAAAVLLTACAGGARVPEDNFYRLDIAAPATRLEVPALAGVLSVQAGATAPIYRDRAFLYSEARTPGQLQRYHYHYWADSPPQLLQRALAEYLRAAGVASAVVTPEDALDARYRLRMDIERFEHVRGRDGGVVVVAARLTLSERGSGVLLLQERLEAEAAVQGGDHADLAAAYQRATQDLYVRIVTAVQARKPQR